MEIHLFSNIKKFSAINFINGQFLPEGMNTDLKFHWQLIFTIQVHEPKELHLVANVFEDLCLWSNGGVN